MERIEFDNWVRPGPDRHPPACATLSPRGNAGNSA